MMENSRQTSIGLQFNIDKLDECRLVTMSKITQNEHVESNFATPARIRNRSWRLLNLRILKGMLKENNAFDGKLTNGLEKTELMEQGSQNNSKRPSLFLNNSRSTLFSHNSGSIHESRERMSSYQEDVEESDDISDISEEDDFDLSDSEAEGEAKAEQNILINDLDEENCQRRIISPATNNKADCIRGFSTSQVPAIKSLIMKETGDFDQSSKSSKSSNSGDATSESSLRDNKVPNKNIFFISSSHSPPCQLKQSNQNSYDSRIKSMNPGNSPAPGLIKRQDSLFGNSQLNINTHLNSKDELNYSSTDISEDGDEDEDDEDDEDDDGDDDDVSKNEGDILDYSDNYSGHSSRKRNLNGAKSMILENSTCDNDSEWISVTSDDEKETERPIPPLKFEKWSTKGHSGNITISSNLLEKDNGTKEGMLKPRSLLSSLFLNEYMTKGSRDTISPQDNQQMKPILKRASTTGIITVHQNSNTIKAPSILFSKKHSSFSELSKKYPHFQNDLVKKNILNTDDVEDDVEEGVVFGKQKSSVEVSNFNVLIKSGSNSFSNSISDHNISGTNKDSSQFTVNNSRHDLLSSSLNKYSKSHSSNSLKNIISKSSLNLSHLFHTSKSKFLRSDSPYQSNADNLRNTLFANANIATNLRSDGRNTISMTKSDRRLNASQNDYSNESGEMDENNRNTELNDREGKEKGPKKLTNSNYLPPVNIHGNLSPKSTRKSMLSTELSQSLKDSIIIDYKLGKIPLPTKVVNKTEHINEKIFIDSLDDTDDYHSKGW